MKEGKPQSDERSMICIGIVLTGRLSRLLLECSSSYLQYSHLAGPRVVRIGHINSGQDVGPQYSANKIIRVYSKKEAWQKFANPTVKVNINGMERWMLDINEEDSQSLRMSKGSSHSNVAVVANRSVENGPDDQVLG